MKKTTFACMAAALLVLSACKDAEQNKETPIVPVDTLAEKMIEPPQEETVVDSATEAKAWEEYMTPTDMHKKMASMDGKWEGEETSWMAEGAAPMGPTKVFAENKMILGGRYQEGIFKGNMMGMPFEGRSTMAYDNARKKFVNTWIDNMGTGIMYMEGTYDDATKTIHLTGKMMDPARGKEMEMRQALILTDDKHHTMEMYCTGKDGKEFKNMEIKFSRK